MSNSNCEVNLIEVAKNKNTTVDENEVAKTIKQKFLDESIINHEQQDEERE